MFEYEEVSSSITFEFFVVNAVGLHVYYDMVKGEWKGEPSSDSDVKKNLVMVEEMKRQQDMNNAQQQRTGDDDDRLKRLFEEPLIDSSNNATPPKIFIRSRL